MDTKDNNITEQIELLTELMRVKSTGVKDNVTEDYTLAYLNENQREFMSENFQNAEFAKELVGRYGKKGTVYVFDDEKGDWEKDKYGTIIKVDIPDYEKRMILDMANRIFEFFMIHPHMIAILNRNKGDNFIVKLLGKSKEEEEVVAYGKDDRSILQKLADRFKGEEVYEEE